MNEKDVIHKSDDEKQEELDSGCRFSHGQYSSTGPESIAGCFPVTHTPVSQAAARLPARPSAVQRVEFMRSPPPGSRVLLNLAQKQFQRFYGFAAFSVITPVISELRRLISDLMKM